jgi:SAM-dependent methyltransferase
VADAILSRLLDRLPVNPPYEGLVADGYDVWLPVDGLLEEEATYRRLLDPVPGTILELGCGTGRPLLRWLEAGYDVEGIDASADMLAKLRSHAAERDLSPTVHHGDIAPLALPRRYAALVCPAGTFMLVDDTERARSALASYRRHLEPGGLLALTLSAPSHDRPTEMTWTVRRTGTDTAGRTIVVNEAVRVDHDQQLVVVFDRVEVYDTAGRLERTELRRHHLRWWPRRQFDDLLEQVGFVDVRSLGDDHGWVATARAPRPAGDRTGAGA